MGSLVSIIMPVFNAENFLDDAIKSILNQTYSHFEFIIIDDGSTDRSAEVIKGYHDKRIRLLHHDTNLGIVASLNDGIKESHGVYIARMDQDDVSLSERIERQVRYMESHPECGVLGTQISFINSRSYVPVMPLTNDEVRCEIIFNNVIAHPTVMMRKAVLETYGLRYDQSYHAAEDYKLWLDIAPYAHICNLPDVLLHYRQHPGQMCQTFNEEQVQHLRLLYERQITALGIDASSDEQEIHNLISSTLFQSSQPWLNKAYEWLLRLKAFNQEKQIYPEPIFTQVLTEKWFMACVREKKVFFWFEKIFFTRPKVRYQRLSKKYSIKIFLRYIKPYMLPA